MEHVLAEVVGPPAVDVLQVAGSVDEDYCRAAFSRYSWLDEVAGDLLAVAGGDLDDCGFCPFAGEEFGGRGGCYLLEFGSCFLLAYVDFVGLGGEAVDVGDPVFVSR